MSVQHHAQEAEAKHPQTAENRSEAPTSTYELATPMAASDALQHAQVMPQAVSPAALLTLQRMTGNRSVSRLLQTRLAPASVGKAGGVVADGVEAHLNARQGGGVPLPNVTRQFMESRFGSDFSGVRVHADGEAAQINRQLQSQAFTHGQNIYFNTNKYDPHSTAGQQLLAHELTHTIQQTGGIAKHATHQISRTPLSRLMRVMDYETFRGLTTTYGFFGGENKRKAIVPVDEALQKYHEEHGQTVVEQTVEMRADFVNLTSLLNAIVKFKVQNQKSNKLEGINKLEKEVRAEINQIKTMGETQPEKQPETRKRSNALIGPPPKVEEEKPKTRARSNAMVLKNPPPPVSLAGDKKTQADTLENEAEKFIKIIQSSDWESKLLNQPNSKVWHEAMSEVSTQMIDTEVKPPIVQAAAKSIIESIKPQIEAAANTKGSEFLYTTLMGREEVSLPNMFKEFDSYVAQFSDMQLQAAMKDPTKLQKALGKALRNEAAAAGAAEAVIPLADALIAKNKVTDALNEAMLKATQPVAKTARQQPTQEAKEQALMIYGETLDRAKVVRSLASIYTKGSREVVQESDKLFEQADEVIDELDYRVKQLRKLATTPPIDKVDESVKGQLADAATKAAQPVAAARGKTLGELAAKQKNWATVNFKPEDITKDAKQKATAKLEDEAFRGDVLKTTLEGSVNSRLAVLGQAIDKLLPPKDPKSNDKSYGLDVELMVPIPVEQTGTVKVNIGFAFNGELSRKDNKTKGGIGLDLKAGVEASHAGLSGSALGTLGGFMEAQADDGVQLMNMVSYYFYRQFRESYVVPRAITNALWGMGGTSGKTSGEEAEIWGRAMEETAFKDEQDYIKAGVKIGGELSGKADAGFAKAKAKLGVTEKFGREYTKESIEQARQGKDLRTTFGPQQSTGRLFSETEIEAGTSFEIGPIAGELKGKFTFEKTQGKDVDASAEIEAGASGKGPVFDLINKLAMFAIPIKDLIDLLVMKIRSRKDGPQDVANKSEMKSQIMGTFGGLGIAAAGMLPKSLLSSVGLGVESAMKVGGALKISTKDMSKPVEGELFIGAESSIGGELGFEGAKVKAKYTRTQKFITLKFPGPEIQFIGGGESKIGLNLEKGPLKAKNIKFGELTTEEIEDEEEEEAENSEESGSKETE